MEKKVGITASRKVSKKEGSLIVAIPPEIARILGVKEGDRICYIFDREKGNVLIVKAEKALEKLERFLTDLGLEWSDASIEFSVPEELAEDILRNTEPQET